MIKMNPEIKAKWVAALRSGEYKQGKNKLREPIGGAFCCLGVLCDLYRQEHNGPWDGMELQEAEDIELPSHRVYGWAGITCRMQASPEVEINGIGSYLSNHNDQGRTFAEIADAIESQL